MKTFRLVGMGLLAIFMSVNFVACSDDDESPAGGGEVAGNKKLTKMESSIAGEDETITFRYDEQGRLVESTAGNYTNTYTWGEGTISVKEGDGSTYTMTLSNGLITESDNGFTYTYNEENRFIKGEGKRASDTVSVVWDGDKLVSVTESENEGENEATFVYNGEVCRKGYFPFVSSIIDFGCDALLTAQPELAGMKSMQLPASQTWGYTDGEKSTSTLTYEFDKEGYIVKILAEEGGVTGTFILTWE